MKTPVCVCRGALRFTPKGRWRIDVIALKEQIKSGTLPTDHRAFIDRVLPGFCDFAEGKIERWRPYERTDHERTDGHHGGAP